MWMGRNRKHGPLEIVVTEDKKKKTEHIIIELSPDDAVYSDRALEGRLLAALAESWNLVSLNTIGAKVIIETRFSSVYGALKSLRSQHVAYMLRGA